VGSRLPSVEKCDKNNEKHHVAGEGAENKGSRSIEGFTRTMTTAIALETSKGDLPLAMGLGIVLIAIVIVVNALAWTARRAGERFAG